MTTGALLVAQHVGVLRLWNEEYPSTPGLAGPGDIDRYLLGLFDKEFFFLAAEMDELPGWAVSFTRDGDIWFAMIVAAGQKGRGYGRILLESMKARHDRLFGRAIDTDGAVK